MRRLIRSFFRALKKLSTKNALKGAPGIHAQGEAALELLFGVIENACARARTEATAVEFKGQILY
ncbi:hypothetical protein [Burkholderia arboris]|uniref:hypothetical protein n=1 Tax=Burkholderia arboris TaxID=488730 RepID=UPI0004D9CD17|nr:hypothetical protein [Burkholderia arboris]MCA8494970.1 hypothetical protein [Burkholderia arboris]